MSLTPSVHYHSNSTGLNYECRLESNIISLNTLKPETRFTCYKAKNTSSIAEVFLSNSPAISQKFDQLVGKISSEHPFHIRAACGQFLVCNKTQNKEPEYRPCTRSDLDEIFKDYIQKHQDPFLISMLHGLVSQDLIISLIKNSFQNQHALVEERYGNKYSYLVFPQSLGLSMLNGIKHISREALDRVHGLYNVSKSHTSKIKKSRLIQQGLRSMFKGKCNTIMKTEGAPLTCMGCSKSPGNHLRTCNQWSARIMQDSKKSTNIQLNRKERNHVQKGYMGWLDVAMKKSMEFVTDWCKPKSKLPWATYK